MSIREPPTHSRCAIMGGTARTGEKKSIKKPGAEGKDRVGEDFLDLLRGATFLPSRFEASSARRQECQNIFRRELGVFHLDAVAGLLDHFRSLAMGKSTRVRFPVRERHHPVVLAPNNQSCRRDAMQTVLERAVVEIRRSKSHARSKPQHLIPPQLIFDVA